MSFADAAAEKLPAMELEAVFAIEFIEKGLSQDRPFFTSYPL